VIGKVDLGVFHGRDVPGPGFRARDSAACLHVRDRSRWFPSGRSAPPKQICRRRGISMSAHRQLVATCPVGEFLDGRSRCRAASQGRIAGKKSQAWAARRWGPPAHAVDTTAARPKLVGHFFHQDSCSPEEYPGPLSMIAGAEHHIGFTGVEGHHGAHPDSPSRICRGHQQLQARQHQGAALSATSAIPSPAVPRRTPAAAVEFPWRMARRTARRSRQRGWVYRRRSAVAWIRLISRTPERLMVRRCADRCGREREHVHVLCAAP